jgi:Fe2+ transport system protein FeoA
VQKVAKEVPVGSTVNLQELKPGDTGEIKSLVGTDHDLSRLTSLGLRNGAKVRVLRAGKTCIVEVDESRICVRTAKGTRIMVQPA